MATNNDILQGRWQDLKRGLRQRWGKLTEDDISKMSGKQEELIYALRRRYGYAEGQALMEIQRWISEQDRDNGVPRRSAGSAAYLQQSGTS